MNKILRLAAVFSLALALAYFLWPAGTRDAEPEITIRSVAPAPEPSRIAPARVTTGSLTAERLPVDEPSESPSAATPPVFDRARGLVRNASGLPLEGIEIIAINRSANGAELARSTAFSNYNGQFTLERLQPGRRYQLNIIPRDGHTAYNLESFIAGQTEQLQDIIMRRVSLVDADGMVVDVNRAPVADFEFVVGSLSTEFPEQAVKSDSTGFFSLREFPAGEIRIATNTTDYFRIQGLKLHPGEYQNLTLMIDRGSHHLAGWVSDTNGAPVTEAQVILKSSFDTGEYQSVSNRATVTDSNGAFEFAKLGGNPATLAIYANGFETRTLRHHFGTYSDYLRVELTPIEAGGGSVQ